MRSPSWSILSQQVRWESLLWSQELHLPPEVLTGLALRLAHRWPDTHAAGGLQLDPSTWAPYAFHSHAKPIASLLMQGAFREELKGTGGWKAMSIACKSISLTELLLTWSPVCWRGQQMALVSSRCRCWHGDGQSLFSWGPVWPAEKSLEVESWCNG